MRWQEASRDWEILEEAKPNEIVVWPVDENGTQRRWRGSPDGISRNPTLYKAKQTESGEYAIYPRWTPKTGH